MKTDQPNMSYVHQLSGGDRDLEKQLFEVVRKELPQEVAAFNREIQTKNFEKAAMDVHKIKHKVMLLGVAEYYYFAEAYEEELRVGINRHEDEFRRLINILQMFVAGYYCGS